MSGTPSRTSQIFDSNNPTFKARGSPAPSRSNSGLFMKPVPKRHHSSKGTTSPSSSRMPSKSNTTLTMGAKKEEPPKAAESTAPQQQGTSSLDTMAQQLEESLERVQAQENKPNKSDLQSEKQGRKKAKEPSMSDSQKELLKLLDSTKLRDALYVCFGTNTYKTKESTTDVYVPEADGWKFPCDGHEPCESIKKLELPEGRGEAFRSEMRKSVLHYNTLKMLKTHWEDKHKDDKTRWHRRVNSIIQARFKYTLIVARVNYAKEEWL